MGRQSSKSKVSKKQIEEAAEIAAEEALEGLEEETEFEDDGVEFNFQQPDLATDVFEEGFKKAMTLRDSPRFHIKKNSQFLTVKDYPYSWEQLQKEFGPGYYQVQCKARSNGRILKSQTEMVGDPNEGREIEADETDTQSTQHDNNLAVLGWLQQNQERAEARAREAAKNQESALATVMQTVMAAQQESSKTMMTMMMESAKQNQTLLLAMMQNQQQKGPDPVVTLLTTLLTKEKPKEGMGWGEVMKLLKDAERDAENRTKNMYEMIEKKSEALAEIKAEAMSGGETEGEESLTKTLIKGFVPVLSQIVANGGAQGLQQRIQEQRQNDGAPIALNEGFVEEQALRPAISGPNVQRPQQPVRQNPGASRNVSSQVTVAQREPATGPQKAASVPAQAPLTVVQPDSPKVSTLDARQKEAIFEFCAPDIGQAMITGTVASKAAEDVIVKLEKEGISRQTVANGFKLEDFYGFAEKFIPADQLAPAKIWLKEFYEGIQKVAAPKPESAKLARPSNGANGGVGNAGTVAAKRSSTPARGTRVQSRDNPKNI